MRQFHNHHIDGLMQDRRNSSVLAMELRLSCTNPLNYHYNENPHTWTMVFMLKQALEFSISNPTVKQPVWCLLCMERQ